MKKIALLSVVACGLLTGCTNNDEKLESSAFERDASGKEETKALSGINKLFANYEKEFSLLKLDGIVAKDSSYESYLRYYKQMLIDKGVGITDTKSAVTYEIVSKTFVENIDDYAVYKIAENIGYTLNGQAVNSTEFNYYILRKIDGEWLIVDRLPLESVNSDESVLPTYIKTH